MMRQLSFSTWLPRLSLGLGLLLGSVGLVLASTLSRFVAGYTGATVRVEWDVRTETDLTSFNLSRRGPYDSDFLPVSSLTPTGQLHYTYTDTCLVSSRANHLPNAVEYRLTLCGPGPDRTYTIGAPSPSSAVQRSWGTIKTMFR